MQQSSDIEQCLVVFLGATVNLELIESPPIAGINYGNQYFKNSSYGNWTGFYDWLRTDDEVVIGIRYWPFPEIRDITKNLLGLPYVLIDANNVFIEIYFSDERNFNPDLSGDQDSMYSMVLITENGNYALAFSTGWLTQSQIQILYSPHQYPLR